MIVVLAAGLLLLAALPAPTSAEMEGWQYQREIAIQENSGETLRDYQVLVALAGSYFPGEAQADGDDIRFTDADGANLRYWIEEFDAGSKRARIWVAVPLIPANGEAKVTMWYGNPGAASESDGEAVFEFFDDFEGTHIDESKWHVNCGTPSVSHGVLSLSGECILSEKTEAFGYNYIFESFSKVSDTGSEPRSFLRSTNCPTATDGSDRFEFGSWTDKNKMKLENVDDGAVDAVTKTEKFPTSFEVLGIARSNTKTESFQNYVPELMNREHVPDSPLYLQLYSWGGETYYVDWARVRKYATPKPTVTLSIPAPMATATATATAAATPAPTPTTGSISVFSAPSGADIHLDGAYKGTTPTTIPDVSSGSHTLKLEKYGYAEWLTSVHVASGVTESITAHLTAVDVSSPVIHIDKPTTIDQNNNGVLEEGEKVGITYSASDPGGVTSMEILLDETLLESQSGAGPYNLTTNSLSMGNHTIRVVATDSKSNTGSRELNLTVERSGPSVYFGTTRTTINKGEDAIFTLSAVNPIGNPPMTVQLILKPPSGVSVTSSSFAKGASGIYTCTQTIESGDNVRSIVMHLTGNEAGTHEIESEVYYQFEGSPKSPTRYETLTLVVDDHNPAPPMPTPTTKPSPGFAAVVVVIGLLAAHLRGRRI
jgi:hypothetical protein